MEQLEFQKKKFKKKMFQITSQKNQPHLRPILKLFSRAVRILFICFFIKKSVSLFNPINNFTNKMNQKYEKKSVFKPE
jgi:hypothetical protein